MVVLAKQQLEAGMLTITDIPDLEFEFNVSKFSDGLAWMLVTG